MTLDEFEQRLASFGWLIFGAMCLIAFAAVIVSAWREALS